MSAPPGFDPKQANVVSQWAYDRPLNACRFDPAGKFVFCGAEDANLIRFSMADGKHVNFAGGHETWVQAIGFSKDGSQVISGVCDGGLIWWETAAASPKPIRTIDAHKGWIRSLDVEVSLYQLATLLRSGLTLLSALRLIAEQSERGERVGRDGAPVADRAHRL